MNAKPAVARPVIEVSRLGKTYGQVTALADVSLTVAAGSILAILGHNGAGKSTLIDILATRIRPTSGTATVCGWDVVRFGQHVRRNIGMTGQFVSMDEAMTGLRNLVLLARLLGATRREARGRADELIDAFGLADAADRRTRTYSGGMRRRLDLAASMLHRPPVLFLDEPTTGLDPVSRAELWNAVERFAASGTAVVLTTQYLEEADRLAHEVIVLAAGAVVARGRPEQLKAEVGQRSATVCFADDGTVDRAIAALARAGLPATRDPFRAAISVPLAAANDITGLVRTLDDAGVAITDITITEPSLDDVYVALHNNQWGSA